MIMNACSRLSFIIRLILLISLPSALLGGCTDESASKTIEPGSPLTISADRLYPLGHAQENVLDSKVGKAVHPKAQRGDLAPPFSRERLLELEIFYKVLMKECDIAFVQEFKHLQAASNVVRLGQGTLEDFRSLDLRNIPKWRRGPIPLRDAAGSVFLVRSHDFKWLLLEIVEAGDDFVAIRWIRQPSGEALFVDDLALLKEASPQLRLGVAADTDHELLHRLVQQSLDGDNGNLIMKEIEVLLKKGVDVNRIHEPAKFNPLHGAAMAGQLKAVQLLLKHGADVNARSSDGWAALHIAAKLGHVQVATELLSLGADSLQQTPKGETALDLAKQVKPPNLPIIETLEHHMFKR